MPDEAPVTSTTLPAKSFVNPYPPVVPTRPHAVPEATEARQLSPHSALDRFQYRRK